MSRVIITAVCLAALPLAGCESTRSLNPFAEKDVVLKGDRQPVFDQKSGFDGPRKLPPPNSDYVGATMRSDQIVAPAPQAPAEPLPPIAPAEPAKTPAGKKAAPAPVPPPPQ